MFTLIRLFLKFVVVILSFFVFEKVILYFFNKIFGNKSKKKPMPNFTERNYCKKCGIELGEDNNSKINTQLCSFCDEENEVRT